jgi:integrase
MQDKRNETARRLPTGIEARHSRQCAVTRGGDRCTCEPSYRASVYVADRKLGQSPFPGKKGVLVRSPAFSGKGALAAAKQWRADAVSAKGRGKNIAPSRRTLREAADEWLAGAKAEPPRVLNRSGHPYKPAAVRGYEHDLRHYVLEDLGGLRLSEVRRRDLQELVDRLVGQGLSGSKVRNVVIPIRVLFRHAMERDEVNANPTSGLRLPNNIGRRERAASPSEAAELLAALPDSIRPIYATAFYAGLRRGEMRALRWHDIDLAKGVITVRRSWDDVTGEITPKSAKGTRTVPLTATLRDELAALKATTRRDGTDFVFGPTGNRPFMPANVRTQAIKAWETANKQRAEKELEPLVPIELHSCRHTFVSLMHDAGLSLERIGDYVGHSSTYMTDRYRHLLEGHEQEAARMLDEYLARADTAGRIAVMTEDN